MAIKEIEQVQKKVARMHGMTVGDMLEAHTSYRKTVRNKAIVQAKTLGYTARELAGHFAMSESGISGILKTKSEARSEAKKEDNDERTNSKV
ncbi:MAG: hypothetical protein DDT23_01018 [candidate division WS2 bacterium]|nr:hypothetical protein [Candidatus Lithacetigena glycinireducens]